MPFFIKPITRTIGSRVESAFLTENFAKHFGFLDSQLASSPDGGKYLCGKDLTAVRTPCCGLNGKFKRLTIVLIRPIS